MIMVCPVRSQWLFSPIHTRRLEVLLLLHPTPPSRHDFRFSFLWLLHCISRRGCALSSLRSNVDCNVRFHLGDQGAALLDCLRISSFNDSADRGSGSPYPPRAAKYFVRSEQRSVGRDFESQPVLSPCDKRSSRTVSESLIKQEGLEPEVQSPSWRKPGSFVRSSCRAVEREDDPFIALHDQAVQVTATSESSPVPPNVQSQYPTRCRSCL